MKGEDREDRSLCSVCKDSERDSSDDLTAKRSPEWREVARETVAEEPWPKVWPLLHSIV